MTILPPTLIAAATGRRPTLAWVMRFVLILAVWAAFAGEGWAQSNTGATPRSGDWRLVVYRWLSPEWMPRLVLWQPRHRSTPVMPSAHATEAEIKAFLKASHQAVGADMNDMGIVLPEGSQVAYDPASMTLVVWTQQVEHDLIESVVDSQMKTVPLYVSSRLHVVEADAAVVRQMMVEAGRKADLRPQWERIVSSIKEGKAREVETLLLETSSGQRAMTRQGSQWSGLGGGDPTGLSLPSRLVGTEFELDPVIGPDGYLMDVAFRLEHHFGTPVERVAAVGQARGSRTVDFQFAACASATTMTAGMVKLVGVWKPPAAAELEYKDVLQAAFLQADLVPLLPEVNRRVEELLKKYGGKMETTPVKKFEPSPLPPGMSVRTFRMPKNFLTMDTSDRNHEQIPAVPPDPFSATGSKDGAPVQRSEFPNLGERLGGITFPEGATAVFNPKTAEIVMCNTPENLEKFDAFVRFLRSKTPVTLGISVHVIQGDAALIRGVESRMRTMADHSSTWQAIGKAVAHGDVKILNSAWFETRSGQHASSHSGGDVMKIFSRAGNAAAGHDDKRDGNAPSPTAGDSGSVRGLTNPQATPVGLSLEVDSTQEKDSPLINLKLALGYDYAPPTRRGPCSDLGGKRDEGTAPQLNFHKYQLRTGIALASGMTRLLGVWKPEGAAEFEKGNVLQAAFLRADIVPVEEVGQKK